MDIWAQLWPNPYPDGKVHLSVVKALSWRISPRCSFEDIWYMVELSGIKDMNDQLATARAIRDIRDKRRQTDIAAM